MDERLASKNNFLRFLFEGGILNPDASTSIRNTNMSTPIDSKVVLEGAIAYGDVTICKVDPAGHSSDVIDE